MLNMPNQRNMHQLNCYLKSTGSLPVNFLIFSLTSFNLSFAFSISFCRIVIPRISAILEKGSTVKLCLITQTSIKNKQEQTQFLTTYGISHCTALQCAMLGSFIIIVFIILYCAVVWERLFSTIILQCTTMYHNDTTMYCNDTTMYHNVNEKYSRTVSYRYDSFVSACLHSATN